jgi:hypothetical protein
MLRVRNMQGKANSWFTRLQPSRSTDIQEAGLLFAAIPAVSYHDRLNVDEGSMSSIRLLRGERSCAIINRRLPLLGA